MMHRKVVLRVVSKFLIPPILLFALYVQWHGDFGPGGGFQAGVIFGAGFILYAIIFGVDAVQRAVPPWLTRLMLVTGVLMYGGTGMACLLLGDNFLDYNALSPHHPVHGQELGILLVELGVGITVSSAMLTIFNVFAGHVRKD